MKEFGEVFCGLSSRRTELWVKEGREIVKFPEMITVQIKKSISTFLEKYIKDVSMILEESIKNIGKIQSSLRSELKLDGNFSVETEKKYKEGVERYLKTREKLVEIGECTSSEIAYSGMGEKILDLEEISKLEFSIVENGEIFED